MMNIEEFVRNIDEKFGEGFVSEDHLSKEEKMRRAHPALQEAWEKYIMLYKLLDTGDVDHDLTADEILEMIKERKRSGP